jgi:hypothetical protein
MAQPASGGTALFHFSRHSAALVEERRRIGLRLLNSIIFIKKDVKSRR